MTNAGRSVAYERRDDGVHFPGQRMPAEWETHAATWIGWPHHRPDWPGKFEPIPWVYAEIVRVLHAHERVEVLCDDEAVQEEARNALVSHGVSLDRVGLHVVGTDRVWLRDSGPTAVMAPNGDVHWVSWRFNAWAKYDNFSRDELIGFSMAERSGLEREEAIRPNGDGRLVLEGGGIETNGAGALLVTEEWLLSSEQVRNPGLGREDYEQAFDHYLGATRPIWLGEGCVGDDTHGHIDDIARFADERTILLAVEDDPTDDNHARSMDNVRRLELAARDWPGGLRVVRIPFPRPVTMNGERLPASYANFYIANGVVLVPTFNDSNDRVALNTIAESFPGREVVGVHAVDLVWGLGTLHCLTQQQPAQGGGR